MDYFTRYGLEFNPFIKNSKEILVNTSEYREALFRLDYLAKTKGFGILTGSAGRGKTTTIRNWTSSLNPSLYKVIYSSLSTLTPNDFYKNLVKELDCEPACNKPNNFRIIQEEITRLAIEKRKTPVIIIDKANTIFEDAAIESILNAADGTPRLINKYCNASMLIGDSQKANLITTDIVMQAINDCELG